jgi:hypothetical protein
LAGASQGAGNQAGFPGGTLVPRSETIPQTAGKLEGKTTTRKKKYPPGAGIHKAEALKSVCCNSFFADSALRCKSKSILATGFYCLIHSGLFSGKPKGAIPMSYFNIDRNPPRVPKRPDAAIIHALGEDLASTAREKRRRRSLQTCHRPAHRPAKPESRHHSGAYVPQFSARVLNDPSVSDGARRCAAKVMELIYRRNRSGRGFQCTVLYLAKCLGRSERTIQTYLAQLRSRGYIRHEVITSERARMCIGIFITLLGPLFPKHHEDEWPLRAMTSGVKKDSENYNKNISNKHERRVSVDFWTLRCMNGVFRSLMKTTPPLQGSVA